MEGVAESRPTFLVAEMIDGKDRMLIGVVGLELYGDAALLRSAAVRRDVRGRGIGTDLVMEALRRAKGRGVKTIYLLTETAKEYFLRFNFRKINRRHVDQRVQQSIEFKRACPKLAVAVRLRLDSTDVR